MLNWIRLESHSSGISFVWSSICLESHSSIILFVWNRTSVESKFKLFVWNRRLVESQPSDRFRTLSDITAALGKRTFPSDSFVSSGSFRFESYSSRITFVWNIIRLEYYLSGITFVYNRIRLESHPRRITIGIIRLESSSCTIATIPFLNRFPLRSIHKFKKAAPSARVIRHAECSQLAMVDSELLLRHAVTCADGQYVGPYSNGFTAEYCALLSSATGRCVHPFGRSEPGAQSTCDSSCEFHLLQGIGRDVDRKFKGAAQFDNLLRSFKTEFGDGSSRLYHRGAARLYGKPYRVLLAPRMDNFKVTLYARGFHTRFMYNYGVLYTALGAKLAASLHNEKVLAFARFERERKDWDKGASKRKKEPKPPSEKAGLRRRCCRNLRSLGRTMIDPGLVVFGVGRGDLRDMFLGAYSTLTQSFKISALVKTRCQQEMLSAMRGGVQQLAEMIAWMRAIRMIVCDRKRCPQRWEGGPRRLRLTIKVVSAHYAWRLIPNVVRLLPDLLVMRSDHNRYVMGVPVNLVATPFPEPSPKTSADRPAHRSALQESKLPIYYWDQVIDALEKLVRFLRMEVILFEKKLVAWDVDMGSEDAGALLFSIEWFVCDMQRCFFVNSCCKLMSFAEIINLF